MTDQLHQDQPIDWAAPKRLAALREYGILDTPPEPAYEDFVKLAQLICGTSVAVLSLIDANRLFFKAEIGLGIRQTPLETSICDHAGPHQELFVVSDTVMDQRFRSSIKVQAPHNLRFYAGALLITPDGQPLGRLCVLDPEPRPQGLTAAQGEALQALARQVMTTMELRRNLVAKSRAEAALAVVSQAHADILASIDNPFLVLDAAYTIVFANRAFAAMAGKADQRLVGRLLLDVMSHRPDYRQSSGMALLTEVMQNRVSRQQEMFSEALGNVWVDIAIYPISDGGIAVFIRNIHDRKNLEVELEATSQALRGQLAEKELLMLETHHRVKNSLQMVQSLLTLQARNITDPDIAQKVVESAARVRIFGALHETLYRVADGTHVDLAAYLTLIVADLNAGMGATLVGRPIRLQAPKLRWPSADVTIVGLVLTELVTNALKYGVGVVKVRLAEDTEHGGDAVLSVTDEGTALSPDFNPAKTAGMGMRLISRLLRDRGGRLEVDRSGPTTSFRVTLNAQTAATFVA